MSFILDQLKKSGKQRKIEMAMRRKSGGADPKTVPPVQQGSSDRSAAEDISRKLPLVMLSLIVVVLVFSAGFLFFGKKSGQLQIAKPAPPPVLQEEPKAPAVRKAETAPPVILKESLPPAPVPQPKPPKTESVAAAENKPKPEKSENVSPVQVAPAGAEKKGDNKARPVPLSPPEMSAGAVAAESIMELRQLPASVRKSLPEIRITSHLYKKDSPLVSINGRIMSAGVNLDNGLYLEEITPDGVIMVFRNHRFFVRAD